MEQRTWVGRGLVEPATLRALRPDGTAHAGIVLLEQRTGGWRA